MKKAVYVIAIVLLVVVTGLCGLTAYGTYTWLASDEVNIRLGVVNDTKAQTSDSMSLALEQASELVVDITFGDVTVSPYDGEDVQIEMVKTAWGRDEAEAKALAKEMTLEVQREAGQLSLTYSPPDNFGVLRQSGVNSIDVTILLPAGVDLMVTTLMGEVTLNGLQADVGVDSEFGGVRIEDHQGELQVNSRNGVIWLDGITSSGVIDITSQFGDLTLNNLDAEGIGINSRNGAIEGENWKAEGEIRLNAEFGAISVLNFQAAEVSLEGRNGAIDLSEGQVSGSITVDAEFSDIELDQVWADGYDLKSRNGDVTLAGAVGPVEVETEFGAIEISEAEAVQLTLNARNGNTTFTGTLDPTTPHTIESEFGEVRLTIPEDSAFDVLMETDFGVIRSEHEIALSGEISEERWRGEINGGGPLLTVITRNGNINLHILFNE